MSTVPVKPYHKIRVGSALLIADAIDRRRRDDCDAACAWLHMASLAAAPTGSPNGRPAMVKKNSGVQRPLHPLEDWHAPAPDGGMGLLHAGRDRRRRELIASLEQGAPLPVTESKGGAAAQQRHAAAPHHRGARGPKGAMGQGPRAQGA